MVRIIFIFLIYKMIRIKYRNTQEGGSVVRNKKNGECMIPAIYNFNVLIIFIIYNIFFTKKNYNSLKDYSINKILV